MNEIAVKLMGKSFYGKIIKDEKDAGNVQRGRAQQPMGTEIYS